MLCRTERQKSVHYSSLFLIYILYCISNGGAFMSNKYPENISPAHTLILFVKILLVITCAGNIYYFLRAGAVKDVIFNIVFAVILIFSAVFHSRKTGVYLLAAYLVLELLYNYIIFAAAALHGLWTQTVTERLFGYTLFTAAMIYLLYRYYKNRIALLK